MSLHSYPEYVDSPIHWLHKQPITWAAKPVKVIASINDETLTEAVDSERTIEYVDIGSVSLSKGIEKTETLLFGESPSRARRVPREGDVLVSTVRTYLKAIAPVTNQPSNLVASTGFAVVRPRPEIEPSYLKYALQEEHFIQEVISRSTGVSYPAINACDIGRVLVSVPGKDEQQVIATFLDRETAKIDALIAEQKRLIELLQEKRQAVISHAVTKGLNPNAPMKDSGVEWLGDVPEHWGVRRLRHIGTLQNGLNISGEAFGEGDPFISYGDVYKNPNVPQKPAGLVRSTPEDKQKYGLERGDVLFTRTSETVDDIGVASTCLEQIPHSTFAGFLIRLRPLKGVLEPRYSTHLFRNQGVKTHFAGTMNMVTRASLSQGELGNLAICLPSLDEQLKIASAIEEMAGQSDQLISSAWKLVALLQERRSALISAAVTGQIDVRGLTEEVAA